jgi:hypothetical protein
MKFATKTTMLTASWRDIETASFQGSITAVQIPGMKEAFQTGKGLGPETDVVAQLSAWVVMGLSAVLFVGSLYRLKSTMDETQRDLREPLVGRKIPPVKFS